MSNWTDRIVFFDGEVFAEDWLFNFSFLKGGARFSIHNNPDGLIEFMQQYKDYIFCGHNVKGYDQYIIRAIIQERGSNHFVKEVNDWIISGKQGWQFAWSNPYWTMNLCDTSLDIVPRKSLKEIEVNLGLNVMESSVPFTLNRKLTAIELQEVRRYCWNDVDSVQALFEARRDYFDTKVTLCELSNLDVAWGLKQTNAQLVAKFLDCKPQDFSADAYEYQFPDQVNQKYLTPVMKDFFLNKLRPTGDEVVDEFKTPKLEIDIAGVPHVLGIGGLHGARKKFHFVSDKDWIILNSDVASYYPALAITFKFLSRALNIEKYEQIRDDRIIYKKTDKKKANAYKLVLNTAYGISLSKFSPAFDMKGGRSICITGQALLIMLIGMLEDAVPSFTLIQSNTDGIMFAIKRTDKLKAEYFLDKWCNITGFQLETDYIQRVHQRDVNNYLYVDMKGDVKAKGGVTSLHKGGDFTATNLAICHKALVNYFVHGTPVEDTINNEQDIKLFQILGRSGSTYEGTVMASSADVKNIDTVKAFLDGKDTPITPVQKTNRIFATKGTKVKLFKFKEVDVFYDKAGKPYVLSKEGKPKYTKKPIINGKLQQFDSVSNCPDSIFMDNIGTFDYPEKIDKSFYIKLTKERIDAFYEKD